MPWLQSPEAPHPFPQSGKVPPSGLISPDDPTGRRVKPELFDRWSPVSLTTLG